MLAEDGLLDEHRIKFLKLLCKHLCHRLVNASVEVDSDPEVLSAAFSDRGNALKHGINLVVGVDHLKLVGCVHFDRLEPLVFLFERGSADVGRTVSANPGIDLHFVAAFAAHKLVNGRAEILSLDVPKRLVDARNCAHENTAAAVEAGAVDGRPDALDIGGILTDQVILVFLNAGKD